MYIPDTIEERSKRYSEYLKSPGWIRISKERMNKDHNHCCLCGCNSNLVVHHLTYDNIDWNNPGSEDVDHDLITLCKECHNHFHAAKQELEDYYKDIEESFLYECKLKLENEFKSFYDTFLIKAIEVNKKYEKRKVPEAEYGAKSKLRGNLISCLSHTLGKGIGTISLPRADMGRSFKTQKPYIIINDNHK